MRKIWRFSPLVFIFLIFFRAPADTDLGWHLRAGEYFWTTGEILRENVLTYFLPNYEWSNSYFFYDILTFEIWRLGGITGLALASGFLGVGIFAIFDRIDPRRKSINFGLFLIFAALGWATFSLGFRAQLFSLAGILATFYFLRRSETAPKFLFALPPLFLFWANLHGGFFLGLAILFFWSAKKIWSQPHDCGKFGGIILASGLATIANPFGVGIFAEAWNHFRAPLDNLIAEWVAPEIFGKSVIATAALFLILATAKKSKMKIFWLATITSFALLALAARRNIALFGLVAILASSELWSAEFAKLEKNKFISLGRNILVGGGILFLIFARAPTEFKTARAENYCREIGRNFPCAAVKFLQSQNSRDKNIFSQFEWGGFLEWQLPKNRFFVDGRMPAWRTKNGESPYFTYLKIIQARPGWENFLTELRTEQILIASGTFLDLELREHKNSNWREIFRDEVAVIFEK